LQLLALRDQLADVLAVGLGLADVLGEAVPQGLGLLDRALQLLARVLEAEELLHVEHVAAAHGEAFCDAFRIFAQQLDIDPFFFLSSSSFSRILASSPRSVGWYQPGSSMPSGK